MKPNCVGGAIKLDLNFIFWGFIWLIRMVQ